LGIAIPTAAAALGAELIEKHFTLSRDLEGPDHPFALEPDELRAMVAAVRDVEASLGSGRLEGPSDAESVEMYMLARSSLHAAAAIPAATVITPEMLTVKRPGYGIKPKHIDLIVGREARVDIEADDAITWDMI
jgi:sialic acid synthase SpsE